MKNAHPRSHKSARRGLLGAIGAMLIAGCAAGDRDDPQTNSTLNSRGPSSNTPAGADGDSFAEQWLAVERAREGQINWPPESAGDNSGSNTSGDGSFWTIVLGTYTGDGHAAAAQMMVTNLRSIAPQVTGAGVHSSEKGSMVIFGRFADPQAGDIQAELARVRAITYQQRPLFRKAMVTRVSIDTRRAAPNDLRSARLRHPRVNPLYTLQVAAWSDFESGEITLEQIRGSAESEARRLRGQGYEAYYHHDNTKRVSIVTVGLFGRDAIDPATGLLSPDVEFLMQRFPYHLVNGEKLEVPVDPRNSRRGTVAQTPSLVGVPE